MRSNRLSPVDNLGYYTDGFGFLKNFVYKPQKKKFEVQETFANSPNFPGKKYRIKMYFPEGYKAEKTRAILLTHGMSAYGIDDVRILELAENLCLSGFLVVLPEFEEVKALRITFETVNSIHDICHIITSMKGLYFENKLGVFCISFTGGMGLAALSRADLQGKISSIVAIGAYSNFDVLNRHAINSFEYDNYASFVFFYNFLEKIIEISEELKKILFESALDNALYRKGANSVALKIKNQLNLRDRKIYDSICSDSVYRKKLSEEICGRMGNIISLSSPIHYIENLVAPVSLIHGKNDRVIPESESVEIANVLKLKGKKYNLEITGLLSHGDKVSLWRRASDIPGLARAFGFFLRQI